jgi:hypothetical protein
VIHFRQEKISMPIPVTPRLGAEDLAFVTTSLPFFSLYNRTYSFSKWMNAVLVSVNHFLDRSPSAACEVNALGAVFVADLALTADEGGCGLMNDLAEGSSCA